MNETILSVSNLNVSLKREKQLFPVVKNMNFKLEKGKVLGIIGESGSGKSITCLSLVGLLQSNKWAVDGAINFKNETIALKNTSALEKLRGREVAMIMQNPASSFNPLSTIESHFFETMAVYNKGNKKNWRLDILELLNRVHIQDPEKVMKMYPFEMSGGMLQRIMIAMTILLNPSVLIADEPTTALDVTVQKQILMELKGLKDENNLSMLLISHDLGVMAQMADEVIVMYAGEVVERAGVIELFNSPKHPYTKALMQSRPSFTKETLFTINGTAPSIEAFETGCSFYARCNERTEECLLKKAQEIEVNENHWVCCKNFEKESMRPLNERIECKRVI